MKPTIPVQAQLGQILERVRNGLSIQQSSHAGGLPVTRIETIADGTINPNRVGYAGLSFDRHGDWTLQEGDLLVSHINSEHHLGKCAIYEGHPEHLVHGMNLLSLRPKSELVDSRYLLHALRSPLFRLQIPAITKRSVNQSSFNISNFRSLSIPLPSLAEQRRITAILDKADAIRRKREEGIRLTEELLRSTFLDMFGDPVACDSKPLAEVAQVVSGVTKGRKLNGRAVEVPYLRVANVQDGYLNLDEIKTIDALPEEVENLALRPGDIVMTEGGDHDKLGRGAIWNHELSPCIHQNHVFRVRLRHDAVLPDYFASFLRTQEAKGYFLRCAKKTTNLASINMTQLKGLPVPIPPIKRQEAFCNAAQSVTTSCEARKRSLDESNSLFAALVQRAFRGEL